MLRRTLAALAALLVLAGNPPPVAAAGDDVDCTDYCADKAAAYCDRIDSWECYWYIMGCLAGCNLKKH